MFFSKNIYSSLDELRKEYIKLLKKYHPDNGGTSADCQALNSEYEFLSTHIQAGQAKGFKLA